MPGAEEEAIEKEKGISNIKSITTLIHQKTPEDIIKIIFSEALEIFDGSVTINAIVPRPEEKKSDGSGDERFKNSRDETGAELICHFSASDIILLRKKYWDF